jgi:hypothetical protein
MTRWAFTADDGQAEDAGGRLVILVVVVALGADGDIPDHAVIVQGGHSQRVVVES